MPLAEEGLSVLCRQSATQWSERDATHVWFRTEGVCTALRAIHDDLFDRHPVRASVSYAYALLKADAAGES